VIGLRATNTRGEVAQVPAEPVPAMS